MSFARKCNTHGETSCELTRTIRTTTLDTARLTLPAQPRQLLPIRRYYDDYDDDGSRGSSKGLSGNRHRFGQRDGGSGGAGSNNNSDRRRQVTTTERLGCRALTWASLDQSALSPVVIVCAIVYIGESGRHNKSASSP